MRVTRVSCQWISSSSSKDDRRVSRRCQKVSKGVIRVSVACPRVTTNPKKTQVKRVINVSRACRDAPTTVNESPHLARTSLESHEGATRVP